MSSATYTFKGIDSNGAPTRGELQGESSAQVAAQLRGRGFTVVEISRKRMAFTLQDIRDLYTPVGSRDLTVMARQMATMVSSGLSLLRALYVLEEQTESPKLARAIVAVRQDVETGFALSQAMSKHPAVFSDLFVSMVAAGEAGGNLEEVLERLANQLEKDDHLKRTVRSAMVYPTLIGCFALAVLVAMVTLIVPVFAGIFKNLHGQLPALTKVLMAVSNAFRSEWYIFVIVPIALAWGFRAAKRTDRGQLVWDRIKLNFPMRIGEIVRKVAIARFARTLATLTSAGVPILQALEITAKTTGNRVIGDPMAEVAERVKDGESLAVPLERSGVFPKIVTQMLAVGEETGNLDEMLHKLADFYDDEVETMLKALTSIIEPVMMLVVGAIVGLVVIAMYLPMFDVYNLVK
jgi:type IV pilus assembly protein PilC